MSLELEYIHEKLKGGKEEMMVEYDQGMKSAERNIRKLYGKKLTSFKLQEQIEIAKGEELEKVYRKFPITT